MSTPYYWAIKKSKYERKLSDPPRKPTRLDHAITLCCCANCRAEGRKITLCIAEATKRLDLAEQLAEKSLVLYWADQIPSPNIEKDINTDSYSRGTNATPKSDLRACSNAFENRVETLIEDAEKFGANAIIGIRSYHDELPDFSSEADFRCDVGGFRASVGFRVRFVRLTPRSVFVVTENIRYLVCRFSGET